MSQTVAFADSAQVKMVSFFPAAFSFEENWILDPPSRNFPTVHFRHHGAGNVAFLDGHVETREHHFWLEVPGSNFMSQAQADLIEEHKLGFVSNGRQFLNRKENTIEESFLENGSDHCGYRGRVCVYPTHDQADLVAPQKDQLGP